MTAASNRLALTSCVPFLPLTVRQPTPKRYSPAFQVAHSRHAKGGFFSTDDAKLANGLLRPADNKPQSFRLLQLLVRSADFFDISISRTATFS